MLIALTEKNVNELNRESPTSNRVKIGSRLQEAESFGVLTHSYAGAHADKTFAIDDLPITPIVRITLTNADAAANLILPATANKLYVIVNTSGQAITVKVAGKTGVSVASAKTAILTSNGTDIVRVTADA